MLAKELLTSMYRNLYAIRTFENECIKLYRKGLIRGYFHPYLGEEAIATGVCAAMRPQDFMTSTHRGHGHAIARGADIKKMVAELLGKDDGYCHGVGGSMHIADINVGGNMGANGIVGAGIPHGVGAALGAKIRGEKDIATVVFTSDGATLGGVFAESVNLAGIWQLPVLFIIENNQYAVDAEIQRMSASNEVYEKAVGLGVKGVKIDGNDIVAVYNEAKSALEHGLAGKGPVLIECETYRHAGHHVNDPGAYMPPDKLEYYKSRDPVDRGRKYLSEAASDDEIRSIEAEVEKTMEEAIEFAQNSPEPDVAEFLAKIERRFA